MKTETLWRVVMSCPFCGSDLLTSTDNPILSKHPLTLSKPVGCPYGGKERHVFTIKAGTIEPA